MPAVTRAAWVLAALACSVAAAGCGFGTNGRSGAVELAVTEQYGTRPVAQATRALSGGHATVLDILAGATRVRTGPGATIASVDGLSGGWSVYVNGIARVGAVARTQIHPGDRVWLDRHPPGAALRTRAVVGSFPEPFGHGRAGKRLPVRVECADPATSTCQDVARRLTVAGVVAAQGGLQTSFTEHTLRVLVGPWAALRTDESAALLGEPPSASGVYARFGADGRSLAVFAADGSTQRTLAAGTGLVAVTRVRGDQPVWIVTGTDERGVAQAARALVESSLIGRYALAVHDDIGIPLPLPSTGGRPPLGGAGRSGP